MDYQLRRLSLIAGLCVSSLTPALAMDSQIGTECASCQFPTAVRMPLCSGVYMGNGVILTTAHCADNVNPGVSSARFGEEDGFQAAFKTTISHCVAHPNGGSTYVNGSSGYAGIDLAYCIVEEVEPMQNIPVIPSMLPVGCERDWLQHEIYNTPDRATVTVVGSGCGQSYNGGNHCADGTKRFVELQLLEQINKHGSSTKLEVDRWDQDKSGIRSGDSGGPMFVSLPDGSWRLIGVTHGTGVFDTVYAEAVPPYLHWIEADSGRDITPCHDYVGGEWVKSPNCGADFPLDSDQGGGSWANACPSAMVGLSWGFQGSCGWVHPDLDIVAPSEPAGLPSLAFDLATNYMIRDITEGRRVDVEATRRDLQAYTVYPFLEGQLPGYLDLDLLGAEILMPTREDGNTSSRTLR